MVDIDLQDAIQVALLISFPITLILTCILAVIIIILHCCRIHRHHDDDDYNQYLFSRRCSSPPYYHQVLAAEEVRVSAAAAAAPPRFREIDWNGSGSYQTFDTTTRRSSSRDEDPLSGGYVADDENSLSRWGSRASGRTSEWVRTGASFETLQEEPLEEDEGEEEEEEEEEECVDSEDELFMRAGDGLSRTSQKDFGRMEDREPASRLLRVRSV